MLGMREDVIFPPMKKKNTFTTVGQVKNSIPGKWAYLGQSQPSRGGSRCEPSVSQKNRKTRLQSAREKKNLLKKLRLSVLGTAMWTNKTKNNLYYQNDGKKGVWRSGRRCK